MISWRAQLIGQVADDLAEDDVADDAGDALREGLLQLLDGDIQVVEQQADVARALQAWRDIQQPALRRHRQLALARRAQPEAVIRADHRLILADRRQEALLLALGSAESARQVVIEPWRLSRLLVSWRA